MPDRREHSGSARHLVPERERCKGNGYGMLLGAGPRVPAGRGTDSRSPESQSARLSTPGASAGTALEVDPIDACGGRSTMAFSRGRQRRRWFETFARAESEDRAETLRTLRAIQAVDGAGTDRKDEAGGAEKRNEDPTLEVHRGNAMCEDHEVVK